MQFSSAGSSDPTATRSPTAGTSATARATSALANPIASIRDGGHLHGDAHRERRQGDARVPAPPRVAIAVGTPAGRRRSRAPLDGAIFRAGDTIPLDGSATDPEDGVASRRRPPLEDRSSTTPTTPIRSSTTSPGTPQSFTTDTGGEPDSDVGYEIFLSATDSTGLTGTTSVVIVPVTSDFTLQTNPPGLGVTLDGQPMTAPLTVDGRRRLPAHDRRAVAADRAAAQTYYFAGWSDGGLPTHEIVTPELDTTFTASFMPPATCSARS